MSASAGHLLKRSLAGASNQQQHQTVDSMDVLKNRSSGGASVGGQQQAKIIHQNLCIDLNMDEATSDSSWASYVQCSTDNILEGDQTHWLCCALYISCRKSKTPTVGRADALVEGNCVSLTRLLRSCKITFHEFFQKIKSWMDMVNSDKEFRERIERLQSNLCVSLLVYEKYQAIFKGLFVGLQIDEPKKSKKSTRSQPCSPNKVYEFCWYLFLNIKSEYPENSVDLVTTFHMLLSCVDMVFVNAVDEKRTDLVSPAYAAKIKGDTKSKCIMEALCDDFNGTLIDALATKTHTWKPMIKRYIGDGLLRGNDQQLRLLSVENFEFNLNAIKRSYEEYVLSVGEIDEGILLAQIENSALNQTLQTQMNESKRQLMPDTPLTRRNCLPNRELHLEPVAMATNSVERLRRYQCHSEVGPPASLRDLLSKHSNDPIPRMQSILDDMSKKFKANFETNAVERFQLAEAVYYRLLENILRMEMTKNFDWKIVNYDVFHIALITCSVEIVIYAYMTQHKFPWILECFSLDAYNFYKIIEPIALNHKDLLSRDVIKHLNSIEEHCIESLVWRSDSPLWEFIAQSGDNLPGRQLADMPKQQLEKSNDLSGVQPHNPNYNRNDIDRNLLQSPVMGAAERFQHSPGENVSKQLFKPTKDESPTASTSSSTTTNNVDGDATKARKSVRGGGGGSMNLFFRKFYKLACLRMRDICNTLAYTNETDLRKIWTIFEYSVKKQTHLLRDRHLDQILMCSVYVFGRNNNPNAVQVLFKEIMQAYRKQPQATSEVYRDVHMTEQDKAQDKYSTNQDANAKYDIIKFYNNCYVRSIQEFVINTKEDGMLSPLPAYPNPLQSPRKISEHHSLYIQPFEPRDFPQSPNTLTYSFKSSPIEDLVKINRIVNNQNAASSNGKRVLPFDTSEEATPRHIFKVTRLTSVMNEAEPQVPYIREKLQKIITDRQGN